MIHRVRKIRISRDLLGVLVQLLAGLGLVIGVVGCGARMPEKCSWPGKDDVRPAAGPVQDGVGAALTSDEIRDTWDRLPRFRRVTAITRVGEPTHHFFVSYRCISPNSLHIEAWRGPDGRPRMEVVRSTWGGLSVTPPGWVPQPVPEELGEFEERIRDQLEETDASKVRVSYGGYYREVEVMEAAVMQHSEGEGSTEADRESSLEGPLAWYGRAVFAVAEDGESLAGVPMEARPLRMTAGMGYFCSERCRKPWWVKEADALVAINDSVPGLLDMGWNGLEQPAPAWVEAVLRQTRSAIAGNERIPLPVPANAADVQQSTRRESLPPDFTQRVTVQSEVFGRKRPGSGVGPDSVQRNISWSARELVLAVGPVSRQWSVEVAGEELSMELVLELHKPLPPGVSGEMEIEVQATFTVVDGRGNRHEERWPSTVNAFVDGELAAVTSVSADGPKTQGGGHPPRFQLPGNDKYQTIDVYWPVRWISGPPLGAHGKAALEQIPNPSP